MSMLFLAQFGEHVYQFSTFLEDLRRLTAEQQDNIVDHWFALESGTYAEAVNRMHAKKVYGRGKSINHSLPCSTVFAVEGVVNMALKEAQGRIGQRHIEWIMEAVGTAIVAQHLLDRNDRDLLMMPWRMRNTKWEPKSDVEQ